MRLVIDKPGVYYGQCSEICGSNHGFMPIVVEAVFPFLDYIAHEEARKASEFERNRHLVSNQIVVIAEQASVVFDKQIYTQDSIQHSEVELPKEASEVLSPEAEDARRQEILRLTAEFREFRSAIAEFDKRADELISSASSSSEGSSEAP